MKSSKKLACVFFSSPHADSYTSKLLKIFIDHAPNYRFIKINAYRKNVSPCIDCGYCKSHQACIFKDMEDIDTYLKKADLLIFASPVYNFSFPAPMKAILDRMQRYFCARFHMNIKPPIEKKKNAVLILQKSYDRNLLTGILLL